MAYEHGKITNEGIAKVRERIGKGFEGRQPWRTEVSRDTIWHLAHAIGDLSPLYTDREYVKKNTKWGKLQCPGVVLRCYDTPSAPGSAGLPEGLPGVHSIWSGSHYEWYRPVLEGDQIRAESYLKDVVEKASKFTDGRTVYMTYEAVYYDQTNACIGKRSDTYMRADRNKTREKGVYKEIEPLEPEPATGIEPTGGPVEPHERWVIRQFRKRFPVTGGYHGHSFFVRHEGRLHATPLFICLLFLEMTDPKPAFEWFVEQFFFERLHIVMSELYCFRKRKTAAVNY